MAGIGYGYVERNADSYTNWYEVGKYATDMLDETARVRQEKKDALEQATRDSLKRIADTPIGAHASTRKAALEMANVASNSLLIQHKMMLSGKLDPKDYLIYNQNALDTIDLAFNANKAYQENWSKIMEGVKSGDMSGLTLSNAAKAEKYGDWNKMGWQMSPEGNLMVGLKEEQDINGQKVTTLGDLTSVTALNGLLLNTIPHNKLEEQTTNWVKSLGKNQLAVWKKAGFNQQGAVITEENITKRVDLTLDEKNIAFQFINAEKQQVTALLGDPTNIASILFDTKRTTNDGIAYEPTDSSEEAKKDPSKILRVYNQDTGGYNFVVSEKQRKEAEEYAFNRMREKYDVVEKIDVGTQLTKQYAPGYMFKGDDDKKPAVKSKEILNITKTNTKTGKKRLTGISQRLDNLNFEEADGVQNVGETIGYNGETGALEIKGYQVTGKESAGTAEDQAVISYDEEGNEIKTPKKVTKGKNVTNKVYFLKNDLNNADLLSTIVTRIPNPEDENGGNFQNIAQAKAYYRKVYQGRTGKKELD